MAKLYFRYSAMNAGKSIALLQVAHNYERQGKEVLLYTAAIDDRFGEAKIASRLGVSRDALVFKHDTNMLETIAKDSQGKEISCILVDEAQFMTDVQVRNLHYYAHVYGVPVICYGLRTDFRGNPFEGSITLLALADSLDELKTVCQCNKKATMNIRVAENGKRVVTGNQIEIGDQVYRQVCGNCFYTMEIDH
jgi:thymidine kinase